MKHYTLTTCLLAFICCLLVAGTNWLINPFLMFRSPVIDGINTFATECYYKQLVFKPYLLNNIQPRSLIIGASHGGIAFNPDHLPQPAYNLAIGGASSYINWRLLEESVAGNARLEHVLLEAPFFAFNSDDPNNMPERDMQFERRLRHASQGISSIDIAGQYMNDTLSSLLSWESMRASLRMIQKQESIARKTRGSFIGNRNGQWIQQAPPGMSTWTLFENSWRKFLYDEWFPAPLRRFTFDQQGEPLRYFRQSLALLYQRDIKTQVVIAPLHGSLLLALEESGLWPTLTEWKTALVRINEEEAARHGKTPFILVDYATINTYTVAVLPAAHDSKERVLWFNDAAHASPVLGELVLQELQGSVKTGMALSSDNIESHLAQSTQALADYRLQHPEFLSVIQLLMDNAPADTHFPARQ